MSFYLTAAYLFLFGMVFLGVSKTMLNGMRDQFTWWSGFLTGVATTVAVIAFLFNF